MDKELTYTPGPWRLHEDYPQVIVAVAEPTTSLLSLKYEEGYEDPIAQVAKAADARLIAAAPDMREALGVAAGALALPTSDGGKSQALAIVRAAIALAEGRHHG